MKHVYKALEIKQGDAVFYVFSARASEVWKFSKINKKTDDKDEGYQRALSESRAEDIKKFILNKNTISPAIVIALESSKACFDPVKSCINIEDLEDSAWVIDGQHRLRGAALADDTSHIELPVIAYIGIDLTEQIFQFVTINKEAKGVPTSLYYDLLKMLPPKTKPSEAAKEVAADIGANLRKNENSIFYDRIVVVTSPKKGQISLNNFVRKTSPLILENKGFFAAYSQQEFSLILENYFQAIKCVFPHEFFRGRERFFQTLGFGAMVNALTTVFSLTVKEKSGFRRNDIIEMLTKSASFDFSSWDKIGTGSAAEIQTGRDFEVHFKNSVNSSDGNSGTIKLI